MAAIRRRLPRESLIYLGDTARLPYGTKSSETVIRYSRECANFLLDRGVKAIVVACNTASAYAIPELSRQLNIPLLGVIEPGARAALEMSRSRVIGVVGTTGTIASNAYGKSLKSLDGGVRVVSRACPLFVPLVEEGWMDDEITHAVVGRYLEGMKQEGIDVLILGCTHYPLIADVIQRQMGDGVSLVDSAETTADSLAHLLGDRGMLAAGDERPAFAGDSAVGQTTTDKSYRIYVTDIPSRFEKLACDFLGEKVPSVTRIDL